MAYIKREKKSIILLSFGPHLEDQPFILINKDFSQAKTEQPTSQQTRFFIFHAQCKRWICILTDCLDTNETPTLWSLGFFYERISINLCGFSQTYSTFLGFIMYDTIVILTVKDYNVQSSISLLYMAALITCTKKHIANIKCFENSNVVFYLYSIRRYYYDQLSYSL